MNHNFILTGCDTDSIMICNRDGGEITVEQREELLNEVNSLFPEYIKFADDGYYKSVLYFKAKNYILYDGKKIKYKGSSLKSSTLEPALKQFIDETVKCLIEDRQQDVLEVYNSYVKQIYTITKDNIKQWSSKKTLTDKVYNSERLNERKLLEAVGTAEYSPGDRVFVFFNEDDGLSLVENFTEGCYNKERLLEKLYKVSRRFEVVTDMSNCFNYKLKKNKKLLNDFFNT